MKKDRRLRYLTGCICALFISSCDMGDANQVQDFSNPAFANPNGDGPISGWTDWFNRDLPGGSGDWEKSFSDPCNGNMAVKTAVETSSGIPWQYTGDKIHILPEKGAFCLKKEQPYNICQDYRVQFYCSDDAFDKEVPYDFATLYSTRFTREQRINNQLVRAPGKINKVLRYGNFLLAAGDFDQVEQIDNKGVVTVYYHEDLAVFNLSTGKFSSEYQISMETANGDTTEIQDIIQVGNGFVIGGRFDSISNSRDNVDCSNVAYLYLDNFDFYPVGLSIDTSSGIRSAVLDGTVNALAFTFEEGNELSGTLYAGGGFEHIRSEDGSYVVTQKHLLSATAQDGQFVISNLFEGPEHVVSAMERTPDDTQSFVMGFSGVKSGSPLTLCTSDPGAPECNLFTARPGWTVFNFGPGDLQQGAVLDVAFSTGVVYAAVGGNANRVIAFDRNTREGIWLGHVAGGDTQSIAVNNGVAYFSSHDDVSGPSPGAPNRTVDQNTPKYRMGVMDADNGTLLTPTATPKLAWDAPAMQTEYWGLWDIDVSDDWLILAGQFAEIDQVFVKVTKVQAAPGKILKSDDIRIHNPYLNCSNSNPGFKNFASHICDPNYISKNVGLAIFARASY